MRKSIVWIIIVVLLAVMLTILWRGSKQSEAPATVSNEQSEAPATVSSAQSEAPATVSNEQSEASVTVSNEQSEASVTVSIGIATWAGFASGYVGMEKGFFGDNMVVETKILDDMSARHAALQSGAIDIMITSIHGFAQEIAQGVAGQILLVSDESWGGDGIVCHEEIGATSVLRGKAIAYARATPSHYLLLKVLESEGIPLSEWMAIELDDPGRAADAFLSGNGAAVATSGPFLTKAAEGGNAKLLLTTKDYPDIIVNVLAASDQLCTQQRTLHRFLSGWLEAVDFVKSYPDEAAGIMSKGLNVPVDGVQGMMARLRFADRKRNGHFFNSSQPEETRAAKLLDEAGTCWKSVGVVKEPVKGASRVSQVSCGYFNE